MVGEFFALGSKGPMVSSIHQKLLEAGYSIEHPELIAALFGLSTDKCVKDFQACHVDKDGKKLEPDGVIGPRTMWALDNRDGPQESFIADGWRYELNQAHPRMRPVIERAIADIGAKEDAKTPNDGTAIAKFFPDQRLRGLPWCAFAVSYWMKSCFDGNPLDHPLASALKWKEWGTHGKCALDSSKAQAGDVFVILKSDLRGHVGLIVGTNDDGALSTVEGNVGNAVRGCVRRYQAFTCVVRPVML